MQAMDKAWRNLLGRLAGLIAVAMLLTVAAGCMYPKEMRKENQMNVSDSLMLVQNAVNQYKEKTGVLPIKNSVSDTPLYEKYVLDLKKLIQGPYLGQIPTIAFENGGSYLFVLVNPEQKPEVKLIDVIAYQKTGDLQKRVDSYKTANNGAVPTGEPAGQDVFRLDFTKLGIKAEQVQSVYSRQYAGFVIDKQGTVAVDYAADIMQAMQRKGMKSADAGSDLREVLVTESPFVPAKSFPYYWVNNEPQASSAAH
ncbi:hypothetical protein [Paenibacillus sp. GCM10012303]|uniref:hypothetical protein n=1 Tax=Paenibacillus sp. GCM10012303 TaxID=3317340 RepID=UPI0036D30B0D